MPFGHVLDAPALRASGFAPCSPYGGPVFRVCALRFAPCARRSSRFAASGFAPILNSAWSSHCAHKLACGTPCFIGLTSACFAHCARPPCAPALTLARCSASADCLRAPLVNPSVTAYAVPPPFGTKGRLDGGFWTVQLHAIVPLSKRLPCAKGAVGVSRLRDCLIMLSAKLTEGLPHHTIRDVDCRVAPSHYPRSQLRDFLTAASMYAHTP